MSLENQIVVARLHMANITRWAQCVHIKGGICFHSLLNSPISLLFKAKLSHGQNCLQHKWMKIKTTNHTAVWLLTCCIDGTVFESESEHALLTLESESLLGRTISAALLSDLMENCFIVHINSAENIDPMKGSICRNGQNNNLCWEACKIAVKWSTSLLNRLTGPARSANWTTYIGASSLHTAVWAACTTST